MMKETKKKRDEIIVQEINSWPHKHLSSFQGSFPFIAVAVAGVFPAKWHALSVQITFWNPVSSTHSKILWLFGVRST